MTTFNPSDKGSSVTLSNGDLTAACAVTTGVRSTTSRNAGKYYVEFTISAIAVGCLFGISKAAAAVAAPGYPGADTHGRGYFSADGQKYNGTNAAYGASWTTAHLMAFALDIDAGTLEFFKDNVSQGVAFSSGIAGQTWFVHVGAGSSSGSPSTFTANFGGSAFVHTPPSGFTSWDGGGGVIATPSRMMPFFLGAG